MGKLKFLTAIGLLMLFALTVTTTTEARNRPRLVDHDDEYSHPWGGDENNGGSGDLIATPVRPGNYNQYSYVNGTKGGMILGVFQFLWENVEVFLVSITIDNSPQGKTFRGSDATTSTATSSNLGESPGSDGRGGR